LLQRPYRRLTATTAPAAHREKLGLWLVNARLVRLKPVLRAVVRLVVESGGKELRRKQQRKLQQQQT
jgi:hypothetical protein